MNSIPIPEGMPGLISATLVGSRVTCSPPPADTDLDVLVLVGEDQWDEAQAFLVANGYGHDGSDISDKLGFVSDSCFKSYSLGEVNIIVTHDGDFHDRFLAASSVAKRLNLLQKADRVALFQAVLYGNSCVDFS
jgi:hypothetical protein